MSFRMRHRIVAIVLLLAFSVPCFAHPPGSAQHSPPAEGDHQHAVGFVFHDQNGNRKRDEGEPGLAGMRVSNGREIVLTDAQGRYEIDIDNDTIVFVIKPRGWMTPLNAEKLPQFYYIHKPSGSPKQQFPGVAPTGPLPSSVDFPLTPQEEPDQFRALLFGDTQPRDKKEVEYMAHDIIEQVVAEKAHGASLGVTLGDIVFDDLSVFKPHNQAIALVGIPWYNVIGNHDMNFDSPDDKHSDETFESIYGPNYYSFDHGPVHFMVLDDVTWVGATEKEKAHYVGGFGPEQMEFIRNDLALVPENQLIVLMMHVPLLAVEDRQELYRLIEQRPFALSISAHTHFVKHHFIDGADGWRGPEPHHHVVNVTVCGSWWRGAFDELGIPHATMSDGGANGYSIIGFDGAKYSLEYRAARRPADHQMSIYLPEEIYPAQALSTPMIVNVFFGSKKSKVEMRHLPDGQWKEMERVDGIDPYYADMKMAELGPTPPNGMTLPGPSITDHLWRAFLPPVLTPGTHMFEVRTTDMHGHEYIDRESIRVLPYPAPPAKK
jgi:hypothetical protein